MCDINKFMDKLEALEDYLEYVNTDIEQVIAWEPDLYAAYAAHNELPVETIKVWYSDAEDHFVSVFGIESYLQRKYDVWQDEAVDYYYEKEVHRDGTLYQCGGYWFTTE